MNLTVSIPDDFAERLSADGGDIARMAFEALALEEYRAGRLTRPDLRRLLSFETRAELDGFLEAHGIVEAITKTEFDRDKADLDRARGMAAVYRMVALRQGVTLGDGVTVKELIDEGRR